MFRISQRLFKALFSCLDECLVRRRAARTSLNAMRRRQYL